MEIALYVLGAAMLGSLVYVAGWARGRRAGIREGFLRYAAQLRFEKRNTAIIAPTGQPHARNPKGPARVTEAHMSQVRRSWHA